MRIACKEHVDQVMQEVGFRETARPVTPHELLVCFISLTWGGMCGGGRSARRKWTRAVGSGLVARCWGRRGEEA